MMGGTDIVTKPHRTLNDNYD
uniref:Uncharacterized protein n=1 Tax=Lepeophtheirus salmonis TaxID=72036 RepID=A0A0K2TEK1_LEPSM